MTYNYSEAPPFEENVLPADPIHDAPADSVASFDTAEEMGYDREVL
jgi:hypothetical protein